MHSTSWWLLFIIAGREEQGLVPPDLNVLVLLSSGGWCHSALINNQALCIFLQPAWQSRRLFGTKEQTHYRTALEKNEEKETSIGPPGQGYSATNQEGEPPQEGKTKKLDDKMVRLSPSCVQQEHRESHQNQQVRQRPKFPVADIV